MVSVVLVQAGASRYRYGIQKKVADHSIICHCSAVVAVAVALRDYYNNCCCCVCFVVCVCVPSPIRLWTPVLHFRIAWRIDRGHGKKVAQE